MEESGHKSQWWIDFKGATPGATGNNTNRFHNFCIIFGISVNDLVIYLNV